MKTLCMFSGGIDSTYMLWKLLSTTDDEVIAFRFRYDAGHFKYILPGEDLNAPKIVAWLRENIRDFEYKEGSMTLPYELAPHAVYGMFAAIAALNEKPNRVISARNMEDSTYWGHIGQSVLRDIYFCTLESGRVPGDGTKEWTPTWIPFDWPVVKLGKAHFLNELPKEIADLTVTCSTPVIEGETVRGCGDCRHCNRKELYLKRLAEGVDPDTIMDDELKRRSIGPYLTRGENPRPSKYERLKPKEAF